MDDRKMNMEPVRMRMVLRARMMENQLDAGDEDALRREVFLCGMLSQVDGLLGESLKGWHTHHRRSWGGPLKAPG